MRGATLLTAAWPLLVPLAGCADFYSERHLAPLFTEISTAGGGKEIELAGGAVLVRHDQLGGPLRYWALRPLYSWHRRSPSTTFSWLLPPLGSIRRSADEDVFQFLPLIRYLQRHPPDEPPTWTLLVIPGIYWAKTNDGRIVRAWFPFGGLVEHFLSFDRAWFVLFPLYSHVERNGRTTHHFLWPLFSISSGAGGPAWRVWPLIGVNRWEGRYDRWFFLWPLFHWQHNRQLLPRELQEHTRLLWPLIGHRRAGASTSWSFLWPFFGYASNPEKDFWAWDGPWPFVMLQHPGTSGQASRLRIWPLFSRFEGDGLTSYFFLWPFLHWRIEEIQDTTKRTQYVFPVWHSWTRDQKLGKSRWRKLFPVYRYYSADKGDELFFAFPSLNPLWRIGVLDEHYTWMWELYTYHRQEDRIRERSWLGLWRRERDRDEDRRSLAGLWARRDFSVNGDPIHETSILFGLIRWRETPRGATLMRPAIPGPGWPLERVPSTLPSPRDPRPSPAEEGSGRR